MESDGNVRELLRTFTHDQRQLLKLWKDDMKEQVKEFLPKNTRTTT